MKNYLFALAAIVAIAVSTPHQLHAQSDIPTVSIRTMEGQQFSTADISNDGKPIILSFWATWCKPCQRELDAFSEYYHEWQDETGVKIVAVSIDDARATARVAPMVNGRGWDFEVYLDPNSEFRRAMNVVNIPHTFILDGEGKIVSQHTAYYEGAEFEIFEKVKKLVGK